MKPNPSNGSSQSQIPSDRIYEDFDYERRRSAEQADQLMNQVTEELTRTVSPTLLVFLGGTGASIARRVKKMIRDRGLERFVRLLVIDTDERESGVRGKLPGFEPHEFVHLRMERVAEVLNAPESHPALAERFDLADPAVRTALGQIAGRGLRQAGQVRPLGALAFYANFQMVRSHLTRAITDLKTRWNQLEHQLINEGAVDVNNSFHVLLCGSVCGGTGGSMITETATLIHNLVGDETEIHAFLTMPSVYESVLSGTPDEYERVEANAYATLREIDAMQSDWANDHDLLFGPSEHDQTRAPVNLLNQVFLVERRDADGNDLRTPEAVFDTIALHLTADVATTIGGRLEMAEANNFARQGLATCPETNRLRWCSTLDATAAVIPTENILAHTTFCQAVDALSAVVLGPASTVNDVQSAVDGFLTEARLEERSSHNAADNIVNRLKTAAFNTPDVYVNRLYQARSGRRTRHYSDREFPGRFQRVRARFRDTDLPAIRQDMEESQEMLLDESKRRLKSRASKYMVQNGLRGAEAFLSCLIGVMDETLQELNEEANEFATQHKMWETRAVEEIAPLTTMLGKFGRDEARQGTVIQAYRHAVNCAVDMETRRMAAGVVRELQSVAENLRGRVTASIDATESCLRELEQRVMATRPSGRSITTSSRAELDMTTPGFYERFYREHRRDSRELLGRLAEELGESMATTLLTVGSDRRVTPEFIRLCLHELRRQLKSLNIVDVVADQLQSEGRESRDTRLRLIEAVDACRPLWRAKIGRIGEVFSDTIVIGVPESEGGGVPGVVSDVLDEATRVLDNDPRYRAQASHVPTSDPHRIYVMRRSHGGRPHYLLSWEGLRRAYRKWSERGGHPLHVFPRRLVATMPVMEPGNDEADRGELAFALGLGYGWIAQRGPFYYVNLESSDHTGATRFEVPIHSHWNGIGFDSNSPRREGTLALLMDSGRMTYSGRGDSNPQNRLAMGRRESVKALCRNREAIDRIFDAFDTVCERAGYAAVAGELEEYISGLPARSKVGDVNYEQIQREIELLNIRLAELQSGR